MGTSEEVNDVLRVSFTEFEPPWWAGGARWGLRIADSEAASRGED